jgi:hypothetical protein
MSANTTSKIFTCGEYSDNTTVVELFLVDDCVNSIASMLSIGDLLALSLVNSRLKHVLFNKFIVPIESRLNFHQYMLILMTQEKLQRHTTCNLILGPGTGRAPMISWLSTFYSKVLILTRKLWLNDWKRTLRISNADFLMWTSSKNDLSSNKIIVTTIPVIKRHSFNCDIVICHDVELSDNQHKLKYKNILYLSAIPFHYRQDDSNLTQLVRRVIPL